MKHEKFFYGHTPSAVLKTVLVLREKVYETSQFFTCILSTDLFFVPDGLFTIFQVDLLGVVEVSSSAVRKVS